MSGTTQAPLGILASSRLMTAEAEEALQRPPVSCGLSAIDDLALDGGFRYGEITSIAGATATGKTLLAFHAIASHLLSSRNTKVALIDTAGALSLARLRDILVFRLHKESICTIGDKPDGSKSEKAVVKSGPAYDALIKTVEKLLNRVKYMRVFDLAGVIEAVGEVGETWNVQTQSTDEKVKGPLRVIEDSEEEDDMSQDHLDESDHRREENSDQQAGVKELPPSADTGPVDMIVIDTIANVVTSVVSHSQVQGQALLTSFMRSLYLLTTRRRICTILINAMVGLNKSIGPNYRRKQEDDASIFASTAGKPALGKKYAHLINTSILLSSIPKTKADAEIAYGRDGHRGGWETVGVLEVIKDRYGAREGRWATFGILADTELCSAL